MNLLAKDKYRTKIMQHLLHQYENQFPSINDNNEIFNELEITKNEKEKMYNRSMMFAKVSKQKALICDEQITERESKKKIMKEKSVDLIRFKQNYNQNSMTKTKEKQNLKSSSQKVSHKIPQIQLKGHLKKQSFIYHQKLPIMSISKPEDNQGFLNLNKTNKLKYFNENKQNNYEKSNKSQISQNKEKKYRFVVANKVAEALKSRRQEKIQEQHIKQSNEQQSDKVQTQKVLSHQLKSFDATYRSKGSKQMNEFLESARQRLFQNMKPNAQLQRQTVSKQHECQIEKQNNKENAKVISEEKNSLQLNKTFKIEIEISANKTCQIQLSLNSNSKQIARDFIESNKSSLIAFKDLQIQRLEELLSKKISHQLQKQKKIVKAKAEKQVTQRYENIINHVGVNQILVDCNSTQKTDKKKRNNKSEQKLNCKKIKKLQFSHVYIENIDLPPTSQEDQLQLLQVSPKVKNMISFIPKDKQSNSIDSSNQQVKLEGYLNSPHQLITYRPEDSRQHSSNQPGSQNDENNQDVHEEIISNHFPISTYFAETFKQTNVTFSPKRQRNKECSERKNQGLQNEIGAAKILSKSRQKLIKFKQQIKTLNENVQQQKEFKMFSNQQIMPEIKVDSIPQTQTIQTTPNPPYSMINNISSKIVSRLGKENIMNSVRQKQNCKRQKILRQREQKQVEEMKECSFRPKINNLSKSIDKNKKQKIKIGDLLDNGTDNCNQQKESLSNTGKNFFKQSNQFKDANQSSQFDKIMSKLQRPQERYQQLYENHRVVEAKKEFIRQKSMEEISFKPQINKISKKIMETKKNSLNNSVCQQFYSLSNSKASLSRHHSTCKKPSKRNSLQYSNEFYWNENESQQMNKKRKSLNVSRNLQGLQIGDYLYKEAMKMKKKRQSQPVNKVEKFRPLQKSQKIMNKLKEKRLSEYFNQIIGIKQTDQYRQEVENVVLEPSMIDLEQERFSRAPLRYLVPLLQELKELDVSLTKDEFIQSGLKLCNYLSQDEKAEFMSKKWHDNEEQKQNMQHQPCMNKFSQQIVQKKQFYLQDIYHRGLLYKKQVKDKVETDMENKVRRQLEKCTFKPKINNIVQHISYLS